MPRRRNLLENYETWWWFHSAYEVRDGWIRPQSGAELTTYDPWKSSSAAEPSRAYKAFDDLLKIVPVQDNVAIELDDVLAWSCKYGPLGVLPHRTIWMQRPPSAITARDLERLEQLRAADPSNPAMQLDPHAFTKVSVSRFQGGWLTSDVLALGAGTKKLAQSRALLRNRSMDDTRLVGAEPIGQAWGPFFPDVSSSDREEHLYPVPESLEFAQAYCEPLEEWLHWVGMLAAAMELLHDDDAMRWSRGSAVLSWLVQPIAPVLRRDKKNKRVEFAWRSPSLVGSLAMVAMQRLAASQELRRCKDPACTRRFLPANKRARYHSDACRWRHIKETLRAARKSKRRGARPRRNRKQAKP